MTLPLAAAQPIGEIRHLVENLVNVGNDVVAIDPDIRPARRAQRHMEHGAFFRDIDLVAPEHRVDPFAQPAFLGELEQQAHRLVVDPVLRVVEIDAGALGRQSLPARADRRANNCLR